MAQNYLLWGLETMVQNCEATALTRDYVITNLTLFPSSSLSQGSIIYLLLSLLLSVSTKVNLMK